MGRRVLLFLFVLISAVLAVDPFMYDQGTGARDGSNIISTGNLTIQIWDSPTGGSLLYEETFTDSIVNGSWIVRLSNLSFLKYGTVYYKDYQINGVDLDYNGEERIPWMSPYGPVNSSWIDNSTVQLRVTGSCPAGYAMSSINSDGTVNCVSISGSVQVGYNETGDDWLYNDSTGHVLYFNETKFNESVDARIENNGYVNSSGDLWLNISNHVINFNESYLNYTIDHRANYTNGTGLSLVGKQFSIMVCANANDILVWDGSKWVCSPPSSVSNDTQKNASGPWLYNDSTTIYFNESYWNERTNQSIESFGWFNNTEGSYVYNNTQRMILFNESRLNYTIDIRSNYTNGTGLYLVDKVFSLMTCANVNDVLTWDGSKWVCSAISSLSNDTQKNASGPWLYNDTTTIYFNESHWSNLTNERIESYGWFNETEGVYIYNNSNRKILFNETKLNETIDIRSNYTNGSGLILVGKQFSIIPCPNTDDILVWDGSDWICSAISSVANDTQKNASGPWLYNDSTTIYFNETYWSNRTNESILAFNWLNGTLTDYLYVLGRDIGFNESVLNSTISAFLADHTYFNETGASGWLNYSANIVDFNETKLNESLEGYLSDNQYYNETGDSNWLNSSGNVVDLNETKLLEFIQNNSNDTQKNASGPWLYNDTTTIYFNESYWSIRTNESIKAYGWFNSTEGVYIYNNSNREILFNESKLNETIGSYLSNNTYYNETGSSNWLNSSGNIVDFNESKLEEYLDNNVNDTQKNASQPWLYNDSTTIYFNETKFNVSVNESINNYLNDNTYFNDTGSSNWLNSTGNVVDFNETKLEEYIDANVNDTQKNASEPWLYNDSTTIYFNESKFNESVNVSINNYLGDNNYINDTGSNWLNTSNHIIDFNETKLNETIDIRANYTNGSGLLLVGKEFSIIPCPNANDILQWDGSDWVCVAQTSIDTQKNASEPWLYNDSTTIYFNETKFNESLDDFLSDNVYFNETGSSGWLNSSGNTVDLNESKLAEYLGDNVNDTQKNASEPWLYNDTTTIYFNESHWSNLTNDRIESYGWFNETEGVYIYNNSNRKILFNETKLNETIDDRINQSTPWTNTSTQIVPRDGYPNDVNISDGTYYGGAFSSNSPLRLQVHDIDVIFYNDSNNYTGIGRYTSSNSQGSYAVAIGNNATASALGSFAIGVDSESPYEYTYSMGYRSKSYSPYSYAIGYDAYTFGTKGGTYALGLGANASDSYSYAIGYVAKASGSSSFAIGTAAESSGPDSYSIGQYSYASGDGSVALGSGYGPTYKGARSTGLAAVAIGPGDSSHNGAYASGSYAYAIGFNSSAIGSYSYVLGAESFAGSSYSVSIGYDTNASGSASYSLGYLSNAINTASYAIGAYAITPGLHSYAIGYAANSSGDYSYTLGEYSKSSGTSSYTLGDHAHSAGLASYAIGKYANASADHSIAIGDGYDSTCGPKATGVMSVAIGSSTPDSCGHLGPVASGAGAYAIGVRAEASGELSHALGFNAKATGYHSFAMGDDATASGSNSMAIGCDADDDDEVCIKSQKLTLGSLPEYVDSNATVLVRNSADGYVGSGNLYYDPNYFKWFMIKGNVSIPQDLWDSYSSISPTDLVSTQLFYYTDAPTLSLSLRDFSTHRRDGTAYGVSLLGATPSHKVGVGHWVFDASSNQYVDVPDLDINWDKGLTIFAVVKFDDLTQSWSRIIDFGNGQQNDNILLAHDSTSQDLVYEVYTGGTSGGQVRLSGFIDEGSWIAIAVRQVPGTPGSGTTTYLYAIKYSPGSSLISYSSTSGTVALPNNVNRVNNYLGKSNWASDGYFAGQMIHVAVFNRDLGENVVWRVMTNLLREYTFETA